MKKFIPLLALLPALLQANEAVSYACDDGSKISAVFSKNSEERPLATLNIAGSNKELALIPAASGAHYRGEGLNFYTKDNDAIFVDGNGTMRRCSVGNTPPPIVKEQPPAVSSFVDISGSVAYRQRIALPPDAILTIKVQDTSRADAKARTLAEQTIELAGQQVPIAFNLVVDRDLIGKKRARITLSARIEQHGKLLFINDKAYQVKLVDGKSHNDMMLRQVGAALGR